MFSKPSSDQLAKTSFLDINVQNALSCCFSNFELTLYTFSPSIKSLLCTHFFSTRHHSVSLKKNGSFHVTSSDQLRSLEETRFLNNQSVIRYRICIKHNETIGVRLQRLLAFGPSFASLTSDLTLVSPAFGRSDLASELPLVPRVQILGRNRTINNITGCRQLEPRTNSKQNVFLLDLSRTFSL